MLVVLLKVLLFGAGLLIVEAIVSPSLIEPLRSLPLAGGIELPRSAFLPPPTVAFGLRATLEKSEVLPISWKPALGAEAVI